MGFEVTAKELFQKAGLEPTKHPEVFNRVIEILGDCEAQNSVMLGLSMRRIKAYNSQKRSLLKELKEFAKSSGEK